MKGNALTRNGHDLPELYFHLDLQCWQEKTAYSLSEEETDSWTRCKLYWVRKP